MVYLVFFLSLTAVTFGADWLVEGAVQLTKLWGISQIVVGATIVSLGTTLPETLISAFAAVQNKGDVVLGTAIGSIIFNTAIILGFATLIRPPRVKDKDAFYRAGTMIGVLVLFGLLAYDSYISRWDSLLLFAILLLSMFLTVRQGRNNRGEMQENRSDHNLWKPIVRFLLGCLLVVGGAHFLLESGVLIAQQFNVPEAIIAVTLFAAGSSLPELITAITAARKGHTGLVLGNVIGANTLNIVFVMSAAGFIRPFSVPHSTLSFDIPVGLGLMALLLLPAIRTKEIKRWQGVLSIFAYLIYLYIVIL